MKDTKRIILKEEAYTCPIDKTTDTHCCNGLVILAESAYNGAVGMPVVTINSNEEEDGIRTVDATITIDEDICPVHIFIEGAVSDFQADGSTVTFTEV